MSTCQLKSRGCLSSQELRGCRQSTESAEPLYYQTKIYFVKNIKKLTESLAALGAFTGTAAVRCDAAAPATNGAKLLRNGLENER